MKPAAKKSQKTVKFPADIAQAWGCRVFAQRMTGKLKEQLAPVIAALAREDFPKAVKGRRQRDEVVVWGSVFVTLSKDKRKITISEESKVQSLKSKDDELPPADKPAAGELFEAEPNFEKSLDLWQDKLVNPERHLIAPIQAWQMTKLQTYRPQLFKKKDEAASATDGFVFPNFVTNMETLAEYYKKKFEPLAGREFACNKNIIKHWQNGKGFPKTKKWHPAADAGQRFWLFTNQNCFGWFEEVMLPIVKRKDVPELKGLDGITFLPIEAERERLEREEIAMRRAEIQKGLGNLIDVPVAESVFAGFALRVDADLDRFINSKDTLRAAVAKLLLELFTIYDLRFQVEHGAEKFLRELDDRLAKELAAAYDGLKLKFAASQSEQAHQIKELSKPALTTD